MPRTRKRTSRGSGGPRQGVEGAAYSNRSDLNAAPRQAVRTASGQPYGARTAQEEAQRSMPLPATPPARPGMSAPTISDVPAYTGADEVPTFGMPSQRPEEPLTAGLSFGPGRTPGSSDPYRRQPNPVNDDLLDQLRALYSAFPSRELRELIEEAEL